MGRLLVIAPFVTGVDFSKTVLAEPRIDCSATVLAIFEDNGNLPTGGCWGNGTLLFRPTNSAEVVKETTGLLVNVGAFCKLALLATVVTGWIEAVGFVAGTLIVCAGALLKGRATVAPATDAAVLLAALVPK